MHLQRLLKPVRDLMRSTRARNGLTTNALSSVGNLGLTFAIVNRSSLATVGMFALAFSIYAFATSVVKAAITESVLSVVGSVRRRDDAGFEVSLSGLVLAVAIVAVGLGLRSPFIILTGVSIHGVLVYDYIKVTQMALLHPRVALRQELVWTAVTLCGAAAGLARIVGVEGVYGIWALSCALIGYASAIRLKVAISPSWPSKRRETRLTGLYALDQIIGPGTVLLTTYLLAGLSGLAVVGALRAAAAFFGPLSIVSTTGRSLSIPFLARAQLLGPRHELRAALRITGVQVAALAPIALLVSILPLPFLSLLVGTSSASVKPLLLPLAIESVLNLASTVAFSGHRAQRAGLRTVAVFSATGSVRLLMVLLGAHYAGAQGAAVAAAAAASIGVIVIWWSYHDVVVKNAAASALRRSGLSI